MVSPNEGNEVTREACQEVRAPDSTDEVGELARGVGGGKRVAGSLVRCRETRQMLRHLANVSTERQRIANNDSRSRVR